MYVIEKCVVNHGVKARYSKDSAHLWVPAWSGPKAAVGRLSVDDAIRQFVTRTQKVRAVPYRLRVRGEKTVLAAINSLDADWFKKFTICAIGFRAENASTKNAPVLSSVGVVVPGAVGLRVGASDTPDASIVQRVDDAAACLAAAVDTHHVITRFNSNGRSGGAWLVTSLTDGVLSNAEVGLSYTVSSEQVRLQISHKFLATPETGNTLCSLTGKQDHVSQYDTLEQAMLMLRTLVRTSTPAEYALLTAKE